LFNSYVQVDVPIKYLSFFLEEDDELDHIKKVYIFHAGKLSCNSIMKLRSMLKLFTQNQEYKEGRMLSGEVKQRLTAVLSMLVTRHQRARAQVTEEVINFFV
jgi:tryptophanyl-tRNA synthetase